MSARHLRLTRTGKRDSYGAELLTLALMQGSKVLDSLTVVSGAPSRQNFRALANEVRGRLEPIPEGEYQLGPVEWAGPVGDYSASWGSGLGPVWIDCHHSAIGIHLDSNRQTAPGTAGCIGVLTLADLARLVGWFASGAIVLLVVDWGLGTVDVVGVSATYDVLKVFAHSGRWRCLHNDTEQPATQVRMDGHGDRLGLAINGAAVDVVSVDTTIKYRRRK